MNLGRTLTHAAQKWPNKVGLVFEGRRWTFAQWNEDANRAAHTFLARGIRKGDRVAFLTYNLPEQVTGFFALLKIGAVPVPINYRLAPNEVKYIVTDCGARLLVFDEALRDRVDAIRNELPGVEGYLYVGAAPQAGCHSKECPPAEPATAFDPGYSFTFAPVRGHRVRSPRPYVDDESIPAARAQQGGVMGV